jgi:hypothetical protein
VVAVDVRQRSRAPTKHRRQCRLVVPTSKRKLPVFVVCGCGDGGSPNDRSKGKPRESPPQKKKHTHTHTHTHPKLQVCLFLAILASKYISDASISLQDDLVHQAGSEPIGRYFIALLCCYGSGADAPSHAATADEKARNRNSQQQAAAEVARQHKRKTIEVR